MSKILSTKVFLMKKVRKIFKTLIIVFLIFTGIFFASSITYYQSVTKGVSLNKNNLQISNPTQKLQIYDANSKEIKPTSVSYIKLSKLSTNTKNAFICAEDKRFYKHNGLDFIRIGGAIISNVKSGSFSQGGSTISQQLVKNTQLSNEKTIKRKLKEIKLTGELEKNYTKDEILELYLNNIYFGNGCYGIENASNHYFGKSASELTLSESALLASSINAPSIYDIENNLEKTNERKNLILQLMFNSKKITEEEFNGAKSNTPKLNITEISGNSSLYKNIIREACNILGVNEYKLTNSGYKIETSIEKDLCEKIKTANLDTNKNYNKTTLVIDNKTNGVVATFDSTNLLDKKMQPGSTIKPILVYAPAIETGVISPATKILDNKINISGYSPENADKNYHGYISAKTALAKSYNIPAVKLLNEIGIENAKSFAKELGIEFTNSDNHLALALGGFEQGVSPKALCDAYSAFANLGRFQKSSYINKITKNGKTIYEKQENKKQVMSDSTAFLINDMLKECVKSGTAKKLDGFDFEVCSKTGTVGNAKTSKNQLAFNIAYTSKHTIATVVQGENMPPNINGATMPTSINKKVISILYASQKPTNFEKPNSVKSVKVNNEINQETQPLDTLNNENTEEYFSEKNFPKKSEKEFTLEAINSPNHKPILCFTLNKNYNYFLIRSQKNREKIIFSSTENDTNFVKFCDKTAKNNQIYTYKVKFCAKSKNEEFFSNEITLKVY